jgi:hypothetical protein
MDTPRAMRNTPSVLTAGASRGRLAGILNAAFARGLLSEQTLSHRLGILYAERLIDPDGVVGDLSSRVARRRQLLQPLAGRLRAACRRLAFPRVGAIAPLLLALDWGSVDDELVIGRDSDCDVALSDDSVSRRHARLVSRDGAWIIQDLGSTNGTLLNGEPVGRCELRPGDRLQLGTQLLEVD